MLMPKKVKFRKQQKGKRRGKAWRGSSLSFGEYGLKVMECGYITDRQIEASRIAMTRFIKRGGKIWLRLFPDKPITKKPAEVRMGSGKGALDHWVAVVRPGKILYEMELEKIRNLSDEELTHHEKTSAEQLFRLRFQVSLGQNDGVKKLRQLRKEIAQVKTVARERELGIHGETPETKPAAEAKVVKA